MYNIRMFKIVQVGLRPLLVYIYLYELTANPFGPPLDVLHANSHPKSQDSNVSTQRHHTCSTHLMHSVGLVGWAHVHSESLTWKWKPWRR